MGKVRLYTAVRKFLDWAAVNLKPGTVAGYRHYLERFKKKLGNMVLARLTPAKVTTWSRRWHAIQAVQRLVNWCVKDAKILRVNPLVGLKRPRPGARRRVLTDAEFESMIAKSNERFRDFLFVMRETLARPQEVRALTWGDIAGFQGRCFSNRISKRNSLHFSLAGGKGFERRTDDAGERVIPISPALAARLDELAADGVSPDAPILRDTRGRPWSGNAVRCEMARVRRRAGLVADRRGERIVAYTLRHTGATAAAAAGVRDFRLAGVLGHASPRTTTRYVHLRPADLVDAMKVVWESKAGPRPKNDRLGRRRTRPDGSR